MDGQRRGPGRAGRPVGPRAERVRMSRPSGFRLNALLEAAKRFGVKVTCHGGARHPVPWNIPHLHIGVPARVHVPLPPGWLPPGIPCT